MEKEQEAQMEEEDKSSVYPEKLSDPDLEEIYIGLLINDPKQIVKFYFPLSQYKSLIFLKRSLIGVCIRGTFLFGRQT